MLPQDHWLSEQLATLHDLARRGQHRGEGQTFIEWASREHREGFLAAVRQFADAVGARPGVIACVVGHEGLVIAAAGHGDAEAMAAVSQLCVDAARTAATDSGLGRLQQVLVVGERQKIAMFSVGGMSISILAPTTINLAHTLAQASQHAISEAP